ncbi:hypothetical protein [Microbispora sp. NPDC049125]|uniref:hypothetical protein n=1 Tax=Microbispora sp. NPDC049125 TaxID=3154929 RepID=UPI0034678763
MNTTPQPGTDDYAMLLRWDADALQAQIKEMKTAATRRAFNEVTSYAIEYNELYAAPAGQALARDVADYNAKVNAHNAAINKARRAAERAAARAAVQAATCGRCYMIHAPGQDGCE